MIDTTAVFVRALEDVTTTFGYRIPPQAAPPLILVTTSQEQPAATPSLAWWDHAIIIDIHSEDPAEAGTILADAELVVDSLRGAQPEGCVIADLAVIGADHIEDGSWTPTRYRKILTVSVTARSSAPTDPGS